jgi:hypothetical protein
MKFRFHSRSAGLAWFPDIAVGLVESVGRRCALVRRSEIVNAAACSATIFALLNGCSPAQARDTSSTRSSARSEASTQSNLPSFIEFLSSGHPDQTAADLSLEVPSNTDETTHPYCPRDGETVASATQVPAGSTSFPLPKRHPGRETGSQSNGSLRDGRATEEALSADEPITFLSSGGGVCRGF